MSLRVDDVSVGDEMQPGPGADAVHRGDDRLVDMRLAGREARQLGVLRDSPVAARAVSHVGSRAEAPARPGQHHDPDTWVRVDLGPDLRQPVSQLLGQRVQPLRMVERKHHDVVLGPLDQQCAVFLLLDHLWSPILLPQPDVRWHFLRLSRTGGRPGQAAAGFQSRHQAHSREEPARICGFSGPGRGDGSPHRAGRYGQLMSSRLDKSWKVLASPSTPAVDRCAMSSPDRMEPSDSRSSAGILKTSGRGLRSRTLQRGALPQSKRRSRPRGPLSPGSPSCSARRADVLSPAR